MGGLFHSPGPGADTLTAGYLLLGLLVVAVAWRGGTGTRLSREIWVPVALALVFWALVGMAASPARPPQSSRYIYPSAAFLLLFILELTRDVRPTPRVIAATSVALVVSLVPNIVNYKDQADRIRGAAGGERAELAALELLRGEIPAASLPPLIIQAGILHVGNGWPPIAADRYFEAIDRYGSPALDQSQLATASEAQRQAADRVLLDAGDLSIRRFPAGRALSAGTCGTGAGSGVPNASYPVPPEGLLVQPRGSASAVAVTARRFAAAPQPVRLPAGAGPLLLKPAAASVERPWFVVVGGARVCRTR
jgi:hypothetical protein